MRDADDELRLLREAVARLERRLDTIETDDEIGGRAMAVVTVSGGSYPTAGLGITFLVQGQDVTGAESEGALGVLTPRTGNFPAVMIGSGVPPAGTEVVAQDVGNCWVFTYRA